MSLYTDRTHKSDLRRSPSRLAAARRRSQLTLERLEERWTPASVIGLSDTNTLLTFDTASVGTVASPIAVTGLANGEALLGIDFRPSNGLLYGITDQDRLVTINTVTGSATVVASLTADPADASNPFTGLAGTSLGMDFNPTVDRLRVVSNLDENLRINVDNGFVTTDTNLDYAGGDSAGTADPNIAAIAYTNNFAGSTTTSLYGLDIDLDRLVLQNPPNDGTLNSVGTALGVNVGASSALEVVTTGAGTNTAYATTATGSLVTINLATGVATTVGTIGNGLTNLRGLAIVPAGTLDFSVTGYTVSENSGEATVTVTRSGGSLGAVAATYTTVAGTATAGEDYTTTTSTVNFANGQVSQTFTVPILDDMLVEGSETLTITLSNATGDAVLGATTTATLTIRDNESPSVVLYAISDGNTLLELDATDPFNVVRTLPLSNLDLVGGETIVGIDVRPSTGIIYGLAVDGTSAQLVTINPRNGAVVRVGNAFAVTGTDFGFDFNPVADRIRVVSDTGINLSINPVDGVVTTQTPLNPGTPDVVAAAYTNSFTGAGSTTLYVIDSTSDTLSIQLTSTGTLVAVGSLGIDASSVSSFEISPFNNEAFAVITLDGDTDAGLYSIDLATGAATLIGAAPVGGDITGLASFTINDQNFTADQRFVNQLYIDVLGRLPDAGGSAHWVNALDLGASREAVAEAVISSDEAIRLRVNDLYQLLLGRDADAGGLNYWNSVIVNGGTYEQVAVAVLASNEYFVQSGGTNTSFVSALYLDVLGREADAGGLAYFVSRLDAGGSREAVAQALLESGESATLQVNLLYDLFLDEDAPADQLDEFVDDLLDGARLEDIAIAIAASDDYFAQFEA